MYRIARRRVKSDCRHVPIHWGRKSWNQNEIVEMEILGFALWTKNLFLYDFRRPGKGERAPGTTWFDETQVGREDAIYADTPVGFDLKCGAKEKKDDLGMMDMAEKRKKKWKRRRMRRRRIRRWEMDLVKGAHCSNRERRKLRKNVMKELTRNLGNGHFLIHHR